MEEKPNEMYAEKIVLVILSSVAICLLLLACVGLYDLVKVQFSRKVIKRKKGS